MKVELVKFECDNCKRIIRYYPNAYGRPFDWIGMELPPKKSFYGHKSVDFCSADCAIEYLEKSKEEMKYGNSLTGTNNHYNITIKNKEN